MLHVVFRKGLKNLHRIRPEEPSMELLLSEKQRTKEVTFTNNFSFLLLRLLLQVQDNVFCKAARKQLAKKRGENTLQYHSVLLP